MSLSRKAAFGCLAVALLVPVYASAEVVTITATGKVTDLTQFGGLSGGPALITSSFGVGSAISWTISYDTSSWAATSYCIAGVQSCASFGSLTSSKLTIGSYQDSGLQSGIVDWIYTPMSGTLGLSFGDSNPNGALLPSSTGSAGYAPDGYSGYLETGLSPADYSDHPTGAQMANWMTQEYLTTLGSFSFGDGLGDDLVAQSQDLTYSVTYAPSPVPLPPTAYLLASALAALAVGQRALRKASNLILKLIQRLPPETKGSRGYATLPGAP